MLAAPSPEPVYIVMEQASSSPDVWTVLTSVAPFVVSLVALCGVIWSSLHAARTTIKAENRRAEATIQAEDQRARWALEADERRHAQALASDAAQRRSNMRHELYSRIENVNKPLERACRSFTWDRSGDERIRLWSESHAAMSEHLRALSQLRGEASLYASTAVSDAVTEVWVSALGIVVHFEETYDPEKRDEAIPAVIDYASRSAEASRTLRSLMRHELGVDD